MIKWILLAGLVVGYAAQAQAQVVGRNAPPKPSGKVIHLFGPDSVMGNILPTGPGAAPASEGASTAGAPPAGAPSYPEPTMGDVLHQMFITGDPTAGPGFSNNRKITR